MCVCQHRAIANSDYQVWVRGFITIWSPLLTIIHHNQVLIEVSKSFRKYQRKCKVLVEESINNEKVGEGIIVYYVVFSLLQILQFQMRLILMLNNMIGRQNSFRFIFIVLLLNYSTGILFD